MKPLITIHMTPEERAERRHALLQPRPVSQQPPDGAANYHALRIEHPIPCDGGGSKELFHYEKSLERLKQAGYERHLRPAEAFGLIIDSLEGKLSGQPAVVAQNMLESYGEWMSMAVKIENRVIHLYRDPVGLVWNGSDYAVNGTLASTEERTFPLAKTVPTKGRFKKTKALALKAEEYNPLSEISKIAPDFIEYLWSKPYAQLPSDIQKNGGFYLPPEGIIRPVGRGLLDSWSNLFGYYVIRASRGAKK